MDIAIFGAAGLLGEAFSRKLKQDGHSVLEWTRRDVDLSDVDLLRQFLATRQFDLLINTAGMTSLEACLDHPDEAKLVNSIAPEIMAESCREKGCRFVHFSTDYVFSGEAEFAYSETHKASPISQYGRTKLNGEMAVLEAYPDSLVCRVSWLFGHGRDSFVDQVVQASLVGAEQYYISDKWSVPNFADDLVSPCLSLVSKRKTGLFHLSNSSGAASWLTYAEEIVTQLEKLQLVKEGSVILQAVMLDEVSAFRESRPRRTCLQVDKLEAELCEGVGPWRKGLTDYLLNRYVC